MLDEFPLREAARRTLPAITGLLAVASFALVAERLTYAGAWHWPVRPGLAGSIAWQALLATPALAFLYALWSLRAAVAALVRGGGFVPALETGVRRMGFALITGAVLALLVLPALQRVAAAAPSRSIDLDVTSLVLGGIGIGLMLLARLIGVAERQARELAEFF